MKSNTSTSRSINDEIKVNEGNGIEENREKKNVITNKKTFTFSLSWDNPIIRFGEGIQKIKEPTEKYGFEVPRYYSRIFGDSGVSAYLIAIYGLLYSSEWENKISKWQNSILSVADKSLTNCFKEYKTNLSSNCSNGTLLKGDDKTENDATHKKKNGNKREEDKSGGSHKNENENVFVNVNVNVNEATDDHSESAATVSSSYRHQLFNELYFLVDGGTVWADSTYGIPNPYSTDFIKNIYKDCVDGNNRENKVNTEINGRIGENGNNKSKEILPGNDSDGGPEVEINDETKKKEVEVKRKMEKEEKEKENVTPVYEGRTGWFSDTMAIMLQIPEKEFKVHDYIRVIDECLTSNVKYDTNIYNKNDDKKSDGCCYDYNDNHNDDDSINSSTPILDVTLSNESDINTNSTSINTINNSNNMNKINNPSSNSFEIKNPSDDNSSDKYNKSVHENAQNYKSNHDKNNIFIKEIKHILNDKNEILIAAMKVLHFIMNVHDENVKNLQIAGDQVRVIFNFHLFTYIIIFLIFKLCITILLPLHSITYLSYYNLTEIFYLLVHLMRLIIH